MEACRGQPPGQPASQPVGRGESTWARCSWSARGWWASPGDGLAAAAAVTLDRPPSPFLSPCWSALAHHQQPQSFHAFRPARPHHQPRPSSCVLSAADRSALPSPCIVLFCAPLALSHRAPARHGSTAFTARSPHPACPPASAYSPRPLPILHPHLDGACARLLNTPVRLCRAPLRRPPPALAPTHRIPLTAVATAATASAHTHQRIPKARIAPTRPCI